MGRNWGRNWEATGTQLGRNWDATVKGYNVPSGSVSILIFRVAGWSVVNIISQAGWECDWLVVNAISLAGWLVGWLVANIISQAGQAAGWLTVSIISQAGRLAACEHHQPSGPGV